METNCKTKIKALTLTAIIGAFVFGTLWLCLNVSWWFAALWLLLPCYVIIRVAYTIAEMRKPDTTDPFENVAVIRPRNKQPK